MYHKKLKGVTGVLLFATFMFLFLLGCDSGGGSGSASASEVFSDGCIQCLNTNCANEYKECTSHSGCLKTFKCMKDCGDDTECLNGCPDKYVDSVATGVAITDLNLCIHQKCIDECSSKASSAEAADQ